MPPRDTERAGDRWTDLGATAAMERRVALREKFRVEPKISKDTTWDGWRSVVREHDVGWCEAVLAKPPTPEARQVAEALLATGHYDESPDAVEWLRLDAENYATTALEEHAAGGQASVAVLFAMDDSSLHAFPLTHEDVLCAKRDIDLVLAALNLPAEQWPDVEGPAASSPDTIGSAEDPRSEHVGAEVDL